MVAPLSTPDRGIEGRCVGADSQGAEIRLRDIDELPGWLQRGHVAVTRQIDPSTTRRYQQGLRNVDDMDSPLRTALLEAAVPSHEHRSWPGLAALNSAQRHAGSMALSSPSLSLIHGPPGTGKTTLMVALLEALLNDGQRAWALAASNAAVDHLAVCADAAGLPVLRLGAPYRIGAQAQHLTLQARAQRSVLAPALRALDVELARTPPRQRRPLWKQRRALLGQIRANILAECPIVAATLGTMSREQHDLPETKVALIDEATQAIEPAIWSIVPAVERLILLGDPHQLGPVVRMHGNPLERSMLSRLLTAGLPAPMLEEQYRMSASLCALVSETYGPTYRAHASVAGRRLEDLAGVRATPWTTLPAMWVDTSGGGLEEGRDPVTRSLFNEGEVQLVASMVDTLTADGVCLTDIGVIAPYSAQVERLKAALGDVEVATVNAFQGREKEVIICSFVRSNEDGDVGFVADPRRLVVATTRARRLLVCIGDASTLGAIPAFSSLMTAIQQQSPAAWQSVWESPWDAVAFA